jgi:hypothetical protein
MVRNIFHKHVGQELIAITLISILVVATLAGIFYLLGL